MEPHISIVIVTYNRLEKLKKTLSCYSKQTDSFRELIVVDNCSTDGTQEFLDDWKNRKESFLKFVLHMDTNIGGSGGFYEGEKFALSLKPDWIYVADDDAYATENMIAVFKEFLKKNSNEDYSAISGTVVNVDGSISLDHRSNVLFKDGYKFEKIHSTEEQYKLEKFEIDCFSYVCTFLNAKKMQKVGLCNPNYFIYFDDTEHSLRLREVGKIVCVPSIKIIHDGGGIIAIKDDNVLTTWRDYYSVRNQMNMLVKRNKKSALYFFVQTFKRKWIRYKFSYSSMKLIMSALLDGMFNRLGIHSIYKPGFSINK